MKLKLFQWFYLIVCFILKILKKLILLKKTKDNKLQLCKIYFIDLLYNENAEISTKIVRQVTTQFDNANVKSDSSE